MDTRVNGAVARPPTAFMGSDISLDIGKDKATVGSASSGHCQNRNLVRKSFIDELKAKLAVMRHRRRSSANVASVALFASEAKRAAAAQAAGDTSQAATDSNVGNCTPMHSGNRLYPARVFTTPKGEAIAQRRLRQPSYCDKGDIAPTNANVKTKAPKAVFGENVIAFCGNECHITMADEGIVFAGKHAKIFVGDHSAIEIGRPYPTVSDSGSRVADKSTVVIGQNCTVYAGDHTTVHAGKKARIYAESVSFVRTGHNSTLHFAEMST